MTPKAQDKDEERDSYKIFKKYLNEMKNITNKDDWFEFVCSIMGTVETMYGKDSTKHCNLERLLKIEDEKEPLERAQKSLTIHLKAIIDEIKTVGLLNNEQMTNAPIVNNQFSPNVSQINNMNVVVSALNEQLPPITLNEVKEILKGKETAEKKKSKILEAVKSTGENIIAKTLTEILMKTFMGQ